MGNPLQSVGTRAGVSLVPKRDGCRLSEEELNQNLRRVARDVRVTSVRARTRRDPDGPFMDSEQRSNSANVSVWTPRSEPIEDERDAKRRRGAVMVSGKRPPIGRILCRFFSSRPPLGCPI